MSLLRSAKLAPVVDYPVLERFWRRGGAGAGRAILDGAVRRLHALLILGLHARRPGPGFPS